MPTDRRPPCRAEDLPGLVWLLSDPAVAGTRHASAASDLLAEVLTVVTAAPHEVSSEERRALATRTAMLLRAVSDDVRGAAEAAREAPARWPRQARPGGDLTGGALAGADLRSAPLRGARLARADLRDADLRGADLLDASLDGADVRGARLDGALFLEQAQVDSMTGNHRTTLPERLSRPVAWD